MHVEEEATNQIGNQQKTLVTVESHPMNVELHLETELYLDAKLQNEEITYFDSEVSTHERYVEIPDKDAHSDTKAERQNEETRTKPRFSKYVRRHHPADQIIGNKDARPMARNKLRSESCLLSMKEPKVVKDALEDNDLCKAME